MKVENYVTVKTIEEAVELLHKNEKNVILGGGAWLKFMRKPIHTLIDLSALNLDVIEETKKVYKIGAMTTLETVCNDDRIQTLCDGLICEALGQILGVAFRNTVTIGGSVMGRYAFSDLLPALLVLKASLIFHDRGEMTLEDYLNHKGSIKDVLLYIQIPKQNGRGFFKKVANTQLDFAVLNMAVVYHNEYAVAIGARPGAAVLAHDVMNLLNEASEVDDKTIDMAVTKMRETIKFSANPRGSKAYREQLAKTYLKRGLKAVNTDDC